MAAAGLIGSDSSGGSAAARGSGARAVGRLDELEERLERQLDVGDDRVAHRRPRGLVGVAGDRDQRRAGRQQRAREVRVVGEDLRADHEDQVVAGERLGQRPDRRRQHAAEVRVVLGEADAPAAGGGRRPHRQLRALGELDRGVPGAALVGVRADDEHRVARRREPAREVGDPLRVGAGAAAHGAARLMCHRVVVDLGAPVVHRDRHEHRALRRQRREVGGARDRVRDVLRARRLVAPLHERVRHAGGVAVGQQRLQRHQRARLLAGGDHQRRLVGLGGEQRAHRVADAGRGVQVHERGPPARLRVAVGDPDRDALVQPEDVAEVAGELLEERELGRPGVAEHRGHPLLAQEVVGRLAHRRHAGIAPYG